MFNEAYQGFQWFGLSHILAILFFVTLIIFMLFFKNNINPRIDRILRRSIAILMVSMEFIFYLWSLMLTGFQTSLLPFGVCAIAMYVTAYTLWCRSENTFKIIFPWAIIGSLISLTVADLTYDFPHFRYFHYFGNHGLFLLSNLYLLIVCSFKITYKDILKSSMILLVYAVIIYPLNYLLNSNHLFLREVPTEVAFLYAFLGDYWVIGFIISIALLIQLTYLPVALYQHKKA